MIAIVVSVIAIILILVVVVFLITYKMKDDKDKRQALTGVIQNVNTVNAVVDERQDEAASRLNAIDSTLSKLGDVFVKKNDLRMRVVSDVGEFNAVKIKTHNIYSVDDTLSLGDATGTVKVDGTLMSSKGLFTTFGGSNVHVINFDNSKININKDDKFPNGTSLGSKISLGSAANLWNISVDSTDGNLVLGASPTKNYALTKDGTLQAPSIKVPAAKSTLTTTAGTSKVFTEFPAADEINRVQGDTIFNGNIISFGHLHFDTSTPASPGSRYGVGKFNDTHVRVFSASSAPSSTVSLSTAKADGSFEDHISVNADGSIRLRGGKINVASTGEMTSDSHITAAKLTSPSLCSGNQCLTQSDVANVKSVLPLVSSTNGTTTISGNLNAGSTICAGNQCLTADDIQRLRAMIVR